MSEVPAAADRGLLRSGDEAAAEGDEAEQLVPGAAAERGPGRESSGGEGEEDRDAKEEEDEEDARSNGRENGVSGSMAWQTLLPLCFQQFCETWNSDSLYAFVSFLVLDFSPDLTPDQAGRLAGFVAGGLLSRVLLFANVWRISLAPRLAQFNPFALLTHFCKQQVCISWASLPARTFGAI